jgi:type I restriction enzyme S subunit
VLIRPNPKRANSRFIRLWLNSPVLSRHIRGFRDGTVAERLNMPTIRGLPVPIVPLDEQDAIADLLGSLDDKIELNRRMNETLEAMAQAIFRDWFVDFGPTRRKMAGTTDPVSIMGGLTPDPARAEELAAVFPNELGDDGSPQGWAERSLGDDLNILMGQSPPGSTYSEEGIGLPFFQGRRDFGFRFPKARVYCSDPARLAQADHTL